MSCKANIEQLSAETRQKIDNDLTIKLEDNKYSFGQPRYFYPHEVINDDVYLPFAFAYSQLKLNRPLRNQFPSMNVEFKGNLRPEQNDVKKEAVNILNKKGSVIISAYTGFGKCLGINTPVLMYDGTIKMVQDIKEGEKLMGDDSKPRTVLATSKGLDKLYRVKQNSGDDYVDLPDNEWSSYYSGTICVWVNPDTIPSFFGWSAIYTNHMLNGWNDRIYLGVSM